jgi:hypothetical protein
MRRYAKNWSRAWAELSTLQILCGYNVEVGSVEINKKDKANKSTLR